MSETISAGHRQLATEEPDNYFAQWSKEATEARHTVASLGEKLMPQFAADLVARRAQQAKTLAHIEVPLSDDFLYHVPWTYDLVDHSLSGYTPEYRQQRNVEHLCEWWFETQPKFRGLKASAHISHWCFCRYGYVIVRWHPVRDERWQVA